MDATWRERPPPNKRQQTSSSHDSAAKAVELIRQGKAEALMKGSLHTDELMGAVVARETGIRTARRISHCFVMDVPGHKDPPRQAHYSQLSRAASSRNCKIKLKFYRLRLSDSAGDVRPARRQYLGDPQHWTRRGARGRRPTSGSKPRAAMIRRPRRSNSSAKERRRP